MNEHELVAAAKRRENSAFTTIMKRYQSQMYYMIYNMVNDRTLAEDLTMEVFEKCFQKIDMYTPTYRLSTWLFRIGRNHTIDYIRTQVKNKPTFVELNNTFHDGNYTPEQEMIMKEDDVRLNLAVNSLKSMYRDVFLLRCDGDSYQEISEKLGLPINTVKIRLKRGREQLEKKLIL
ncbi:MAG TPA: sigma-70 family RNA polymerase sigma factor [bacterium]|jgi:RNA polymerase sigma-70 factor (ECF subfamily)|nr:MAG: ECF RNA polymerase sigma factor SigW [Bacteroidetes bacterium ADurb.Bin028]HOG38265.1 sigma-70 family RNA polymerase sigma factor [bacterium]